MPRPAVQFPQEAADWTYSPVPAVEAAIADIRRKYPPLYPDGLERPRRLLEKLGNPHRRLPFVFHVAGTNGKGSTLAFLQAVFEAGNFGVHKYISPHLVRFEERIVLNGKMIGPDFLLSLIEECDRVAGDTGVSFFEFFTVLAFLAYARHPAEALLLETGLGGLHDATNVVEGPNLVALLTRISHDHNHVLGATLAEIAGHKAGIIKPGCAAVVAPQSSPEVLEAFSAATYFHGSGWEVKPCGDGFTYKSRAHHFDLPLPQLQGTHQTHNAGTALAALENSPYQFLLQQDILERAMRAVVWPGRLQKIETALLPPGWELWLDGAHNDSGAEVLVAQIRAWGTEKPLHLVTAMKRTKDVSGFYRPLLPHVATVQAVDVSWLDAPMLGAASLCDQLRQIGYPQVRPAANLESAIRSLSFPSGPPQRILITGSLYLVGHALREPF